MHPYFSENLSKKHSQTQAKMIESITYVVLGNNY